MNTFVNRAMEKTTAYWSQLTNTQRLFIVGLTTLVLVIFVGFIYWLSRPDFRVLYSKLSPEDANRVVTLLQAEKAPYQLADNGTTVLVSAPQLYDLRLKVAGDGGLVGQGIGFEIFDSVQVGQTDFVQHINYQRALQGELSRTISEFPNVESARVHLVMPQRSLFIEEQQPPSASVTLRLKEANVKMSPKEVQAIVNILTMSVEGLDANHVSISDSSGKAVFTPEDEGASMNNSQLEYRSRMESTFERRISELLTPVLGPGKHIAKVNAALDYSQRTIRREIFDPDSSVIRSEQSTEENQIGRANLESGSPDANFRSDGLANSLSSQEGTRESRTRNFEINKEEHNIIGQQGELTRLTVAVAVDGSYTKDAEGQWVYLPRTAEELERIRLLVANAVGFDAARGDTIEVSTMPFGDSSLPEDPNAAELLAQFAERMGKPLLSALMVFLFIMLVVRPLVLALVRPKVEMGEMVEGLEGLPAAEEQYALFEAQEEAAKNAEENAKSVAAAMEEAEAYVLETNLSLDDIKARTLQLAERNMDQTIYILRNWMQDARVKA